ncbi:kinase-like protein [Ramicandelaber brevisporus]|nr:kinase-like protein [Ramicandelaber brevisporus]
MSRVLARSSSRAVETFYIVKVDGHERGVSKPSRSMQWLDVFEFNVKKARELEITFVDVTAGGDQRSVIGMFWVKLDDVANDIRRQKAEQPERAGVQSTYNVEPIGHADIWLDFSREAKPQREPSKLGRKQAVRKKKEIAMEMKGHRFVNKPFYTIMKCAFCQEYIVNSNGFQCEECNFFCHEKCARSVVTKCASTADGSGGGDETKIHHNIPHRFDNFSNLGANWCCHCGSVLPLGRSSNKRCQECSLTCHANCAKFVPNFCGLRIEEANRILGELKRPTAGASTAAAVAAAVSGGAGSPASRPTATYQPKPQQQQQQQQQQPAQPQSPTQRPPLPPLPPHALQQQQQQQQQQYQQQPYYQYGQYPQQQQYPQYAQYPNAAQAPIPPPVTYQPPVHSVPLQGPPIVVPQPHESVNVQTPTQPQHAPPSYQSTQEAPIPPPIAQPVQQPQQPQQPRIHTQSTPPPVQLQQPPQPQRPQQQVSQIPVSTPPVDAVVEPVQPPPVRQVTLNDFRFHAVVGRGNFGKVMLAEERRSRQFYAIKVLKKDAIIYENEVESLRSERHVFEIANQTRHPFLVGLHSCFHNDTRVFFVMEYIQGGDLMAQIQARPFTERQAKFYACEILLGLEYLHQQGIVYRDLKLENILLVLDGHIKIADYGLCKASMQRGNTTSTFCGTPEFMAPEIVLEQPYDRSVDWWAFGVLIYQMILCRSPFTGDDQDEIFEAIVESEVLYPVTMSRDSVSICQMLMEREPHRRLGAGPADATEIKNHAFFRGTVWDDVLNKRVQAPFRPRIRDAMDISNFDREFTSERAIITPTNSILTPREQEEFSDFSYIANWAL